MVAVGLEQKNYGAGCVRKESLMSTSDFDGHKRAVQWYGRGHGWYVVFVGWIERSVGGAVCVGAG